MPAPVVFVHDDPTFTEACATALRVEGYDVAAFTDPMLALDELDTASTVDLLITRVAYAPGKPNGLALARMARVKRPNIRIIFLAVPTAIEHIEGWGDFVQLPATPAEILTAMKEGFGTQGSQAKVMRPPSDATALSLHLLLLLAVLIVLAVGVVLLAYWVA